MLRKVIGPAAGLAIGLGLAACAPSGPHGIPEGTIMSRTAAPPGGLIGLPMAVPAGEAADHAACGAARDASSGTKCK